MLASYCKYWAVRTSTSGVCFKGSMWPTCFLSLITILRFSTRDGVVVLQWKVDDLLASDS